jgi:hypothetical protein
MRIDIKSSLVKCDSIWNRRSSNATRYESSLFKCDSIWNRRSSNTTRYEIVALQMQFDMNLVFKCNNIIKNHHPHLAAWSAIGIGMHPKKRQVSQPRKQRVYRWQAVILNHPTELVSLENANNEKKSANYDTIKFVCLENDNKRPTNSNADKMETNPVNTACISTTNDVIVSNHEIRHTNLCSQSQDSTYSSSLSKQSWDSTYSSSLSMHREIRYTHLRSQIARLDIYSSSLKSRDSTYSSSLSNRETRYIRLRSHRETLHTHLRSNSRDSTYSSSLSIRETRHTRLRSQSRDLTNSFVFGPTHRQYSCNRNG